MKTDPSPIAGSTTIMTRSWGIFWLANALLPALIWQTREQAANPDGRFPQKPIQIIVPFGASGGTDKYARAMKRAIDLARRQKVARLEEVALHRAVGAVQVKLGIMQQIEIHRLDRVRLRHAGKDR